MDSPRINPREAHARVSDSDALLVCAYADPDKCRDLYLAGAIPLTELEKREDELASDRELLFYCN